MWTFGKKLALGFALSFALLLVIGLVSYRGVDTLTQTSYAVSRTHAAQTHISALLSAMKDAETAQRGYLLTGDETYIEPYRAAIVDVPRIVAELRPIIRDNAAQESRLGQAVVMMDNLLALHKERIETRREAGTDAALRQVKLGEGKRRMDELRKVLGQMEETENDLLRERALEVENAGGAVRAAILWGTAAGLALVLIAALSLSRVLSGQVGSAVRHVQRSAAELQAAANQQAAGARETATSMTEIATTISELLATSRQIADSAQRVVNVADQTALFARGGDGTLQAARETIVAMRRQIDLVVGHMLDLGRKSQQIGVVLDL
ncbi:MAG: CHASE3 domain-containing protein, partial [Burkholderiaceae bacterium]